VPPNDEGPSPPNSSSASSHESSGGPLRLQRRRLACTEGLTASMVRKRINARKQQTQEAEDTLPKHRVPLRRAGPYFIGN
jgi:hypothetical protein